MPSDNKTISYIRITDSNEHQKDALIDATVIANYGDPGLQEDYNFDILSRFVICMIESSNRTLTSNNFNRMIVAVMRPPELWISYQGGVAGSTVNQQRIDANLNTNIGPANNYTTSTISPINIPYQLGETIKIKLIKDNDYLSLLTANTFFQSAWSSSTNGWTTLQQSYGAWHTQGSTLPYINSQAGGIGALQIKTITPYAINGSNSNNPNPDGNFYYICLNKTQYEAFVINQYPEQSNDLVNLFTNSLIDSFPAYYTINGGYAYQSATTYNIPIIMYEDVNIGLKARSAVNNCIPLIVTTPNTFTIPATRNSGTINYNPAYIIQGG